MRRPVEEYVLNKIEREEMVARLMLALRSAGLTTMEIRVFIGALLGYSSNEMARMCERDRDTINHHRTRALRKVQAWLNCTFGEEEVPQFARTWYYQGAS